MTTTAIKPKSGGRGFNIVTADSTSDNLFWSTSGREYSGKSRFGLTFPGPIDYLATDPGCTRAANGIVREHPDKEIRLKTYKLPEPVLRPNQKRMVTTSDGKTTPRMEAEVNFEEYRDLWDEWYADWCWAIGPSDSQTVVVDTGKDIWDVLRGARHGKLIKIMPQDYTSLNMEFEAVLRKATRLSGCAKHIIWIDKMGKQYKATTVTSSQGGTETKDAWNGKWEPKGFGGIGYLAEVTLEHYTEGGLFGVRFGLKSGPNKGLIGAEYINDPVKLEEYTIERQGKALEAGREDWEEVKVKDVCTYEFLMEELYG